MNKSPALRISLIILGCLVLGALFILAIISNFDALLVKSTPFPIQLHSSVQANYQKDPDYMQIPPMDIQLVIDAIWDQNLSSQNLSLRLTQVNDNFLASVASVTPRPTATDTAIPEITATITEGGPTATIDLTPPSTPTETSIGFIASPTATGASETPTITVQSPTDTPHAPTDTAIPPSSTSSPPTNTVSPCSQLLIVSFSTGNKKTSWSVVNNSSTSLPFNSLTLSWPASNGNLSKIFYASSKIWESSASPPSITINPSGQVLPGNTTTRVEFFFVSDSAPSGYTLMLNIDGCVINTSN